MTKERAAELLPLIDKLVAIRGAGASLFYGSECEMVIYPPNRIDPYTFYDGAEPFNAGIEPFVIRDPGLYAAEECLKQIINDSLNA